MSREFVEALRGRVAGITELSEGQVAALETHYELLLKWNKVLNLTRITDADEAVGRHYVESLFLGAHLPAGRLSIVDIGSGAGFPGLPVAVLRPNCNVTLVESHQRKAVFLREISRGMPNIRVRGCRAEDLEERFDWAISRAVSYGDLREPVSRIAGSVAILTGMQVPTDWAALSWQHIPMPGTNSRWLRLGTASFT